MNWERKETKKVNINFIVFISLTDLKVQSENMQAMKIKWKLTTNLNPLVQFIFLEFIYKCYATMTSRYCLQMC